MEKELNRRQLNTGNPLLDDHHEHLYLRFEVPTTESTSQVSVKGFRSAGCPSYREYSSNEYFKTISHYFVFIHSPALHRPLD